MSVRKRMWSSRTGELREAWVVDLVGPKGKRQLKHFKTKREADQFHNLTGAVRSGHVPEAVLTQWFHPVKFVAALPDGFRKDRSARAALADALRSACPLKEPTSKTVILHVNAEMPPHHVVADVDNLLKPVLDALTGIAWINDTQVCELMVRRITGLRRRLHIKMWQVPPTALAPNLTYLMHDTMIEMKGKVKTNVARQ